MKSIPTTLSLVAAAGILSMTTQSQATLLVYEPFDYAAGTTLASMSGALGTTGNWVDTSSGGTGAPMQAQANGSASGTQEWTGIPAGSAFPNTGGFLEGERRDDNEGNIALDPSVTAAFTDGSTIWLSYVSGYAFVSGSPSNHHKPNVAIGQAELIDDRASNAAGQAIGAGAQAQTNAGGTLSATYWDDEDGDGTLFEQFRSHDVPSVIPNDSSGPVPAQQLIIAKIEFGAANDTVTMAVFDIDTGMTMPTETDFDNATLGTITSTNNLDQSTFDTLSFHGSRSNYDEIRIGTDFADMFSTGGGPALPGDTDGDGDIDDSDLGTSFSNYTGPVGAAGGKTAAQGDTDGDGDVDDSDLGTSFSGYTGPLGPASVPEPTSLALLGLGGLALIRRRRNA